MPIAEPVLVRMFRKRYIDPITNCWNYIGCISKNGYGMVHLNGKTRYTHDVSYEELIGPVPDGKELDHGCRNRKCFNPLHLEPVTRLVNIMRGELFILRSHCKRGHPMTEDNVYHRTNQRGRFCKTCHKARMAGRKTRMRTLDFRQGDVGFVAGLIPATAKRIPVRPFALGERTGHSHQVIEDVKDLVEMYEAEDGTTWVRALADLPVRHEDHDPTASKSIITKGWEGEVRICIEYDEEQDFRSVID